MSRGNDARDSGVEWELEDDAPNRRGRALDRVHHSRGGFVEEKTEQQESEIYGVEIDRVERLARLHEVTHQVGAADQDDEPVEYGRMLEPLTRRRPGWRRRCYYLGVAQINAQLFCGFGASGRRGYQPHHRRHQCDLDHDRHQTLPKKNGVLKGDDPARDNSAGCNDVANLRLKGAGRRHLERGRSTQPLGPDAPDPEETGRGQGAIVNPFDAAGDFLSEDGAENKAKAPV